MVHADIIYSNREIQEILRNKTKEGTLYLMYDIDSVVGGVRCYK